MRNAGPQQFELCSDTAGLYCRFNITSGKRSYELGADSHEDMDFWISELSRASRLHTKGVTSERRVSTSVGTAVLCVYICGLTHRRVLTCNGFV